MDSDFDPRYGEERPSRYYGKYAGLVTDNSPPDGGGAHRGQVTVQVPGILEEAADGSSNRPLEILAAPSFLPGFFFVPDQGAQVWVEFVAGDVNFPIWTGVWYPDSGTPQATSPTSPGQTGDAPTLDQKIIRTRSGQVIQLEDTDGGEQIVISDEKNKNLITLNSDGISITASASGGSVTLTFGQTKVVVSSDGITLSATPMAIKVTSEAVTITNVTGSDQNVVLEPLYDWLVNSFLLHEHVGNLGAPTGPPIVPGLPSPSPPNSLSGPST